MGSEPTQSPIPFGDRGERESSQRRSPCSCQGVEATLPAAAAVTAAGKQEDTV